MEQAWVGDLIRHWRDDEVGTYRTWFLWDAPIKNFRSIRRGLQEVIAEIKADTFGNAYRGSSLETVLDSIAEQRQVFKGADHAFMWKPKLRIPDIYENRLNQVAFGNFLNTCLCCSTEEHVIEAIQTWIARPSRAWVPLRPICCTSCIRRLLRRSTPRLFGAITR